MLQKVFFNVDSFNPEPYWTNPIVNLSGNQKFDDPTVFIPGVYSVDVQAGAGSSGGYAGRIQKEIEVTSPFIVRAYCGSKGSSSVEGRNPYSGTFKVNAIGPQDENGVPAVTHIFGNRGSCSKGYFGKLIVMADYCSGNCLGNGIRHSGSSLGAGSCLHLLPVGGVFGTDYLFAFHCTTNRYGYSGGGGGGGGSAYGGAGSGGVYVNDYSLTSYAGGSTPYGSGGAGVTSSAPGLHPGNNGSGPGYGYGGGVSPNGCGAWFNGTTWVDSRDVGGNGEDGHIIIKYIGPLQ